MRVPRLGLAGYQGERFAAAQASPPGTRAEAGIAATTKAKLKAVARVAANSAFMRLVRVMVVTPSRVWRAGRLLSMEFK